MTLCKGCGTELPPNTKATACSRACLNAYHNRRLQRGQIAYDMIMTMRHERDKAKQENIWSALCRQCAQWLHEDQDQRAGAKSWNDPMVHINRNPWLKGNVMVSGFKIGRPLS